MQIDGPQKKAMNRGANSLMNNVAIKLLTERGVDLDAMARLVCQLQQPYNQKLTVASCRNALEAVLSKREVQYAVITGITLDRMAENDSLEEPLGAIVRENNLLYSVDEVLALCIVNIYGSIGLSNFGYLVEERPGCLSRIGTDPDKVDTFLDDLVAALVAATCARIAHNTGYVQ